MRRLVATFFAVLAPVAAAHAALVTVDSPAGPGTAVLDTSSRLEWLKLSTTSNTTVNQVFTQTASGGRFEGFRYSTLSEFYCGLISPNVGMECGLPRFTNNVGSTQAFLDIFDFNFRQGSFHTADAPGGDPEQRFAFTASFSFFPDATFPVEFDSQQIRLSASTLNLPVSHWLVREARNVPEPGTLALIGLSVFAFAARRQANRNGLPRNGEVGT